MSWRTKLRALFRKEKLEADLAEEIRTHLEALTRRNLAAGMSTEEASHAARRSFGGVEQIKERAREARGGMWLEQFFADLRHGARTLLRRDRGFAALVIALLALGIGVSSAVFSVAYSVIWQPLPYAEPERLVAIWSNAPRLSAPRYPVAAADYRDWRARSTAFEDIALARDLASFNLTGSGEPERLSGAQISANLLSVLGVTPLVGRGFAPDEDQIGHERVVLLGHAFWQRRFGGDASVVGRTLQLNGLPFLVAGVLPPDFAFPAGQFDLWVPLTVNPADYQTRSGSTHLAVARLKHGVTLGQARADLDRVAQVLAREFPATNEGTGVTVESLQSDLVRSARRPLLALLGAVGCLLLIASANLANLFFARALARQRELHVRAALGATRGRMVRQMIAEVTPLLLGGGALGWLIARWSVQAMAARLPAEFPRLRDIALHAPAAGLAAGILGLVALGVAVWPAISADRGAAIENLRSQHDLGGGGRRRTRLRDLLLVVEVALTVLLVTGALLLARTFVALESVNLGFRPDGALSLRVAIPRTKYPSDSAVAAFAAQVTERVAAVPGVTAAGIINRLPMGGRTEAWGVDLERTGGEVNRLPTANVCVVTPGYFAAAGIPQFSGRGFGAHDGADAPKVALVDQRIAQRYWPGEEAVGKRLRVDVPGIGWIEIVGVVGHVRMESVDTDPRPQIYLPFAQWPRDRAAVVARTAGQPAALAASIVAAIHALDPDQPVFAVQEMREVVGDTLASRRLATSLVGLFAAASLTLACVGIYGVFAFMVGQRTREFGVRLALGAQRRDVAWLVLRRALILVGAGLAAGLVGVAMGAQTLRALLFEISPLDPVSFAAATLVLLAVALLACWFPARRAAKVDPIVALRCE